MIRRGCLVAVAILVALGPVAGAPPRAEAMGCGFAALRAQAPDVLANCPGDEGRAGDGPRATGARGIQERLDTARSPRDGGASPAPAPNPDPSPERGPRVPIGSGAAPAGWLHWLDYLRSLARLPGLVQDPALDAGAAAHARYIVETGRVAHAEDPASPYYSAAGNAAAAASDLIAFARPASDADALDGLVAGPFHALAPLDPSLTTVGFGSYRDPSRALETAAVVRLGAGWGAPRPNGAGPMARPADGARVPLYTAAAGETPDPLAACPGYAGPAGLPLLFAYGEGKEQTDVGDHALRRDGVPVEHCVFDASSYTNPDPASRAEGRAILATYRAVVIVPRQPLVPGSTYSVRLVVNGRAYAWSFRAVPR